MLRTLAVYYSEDVGPWWIASQCRKSWTASRSISKVRSQRGRPGGLQARALVECKSAQKVMDGVRKCKSVREDVVSVKKYLQGKVTEGAPWRIAS